ncbi:MAG TPA: lytic transglycosylase domain-containing protein [Bryobacteraceae bacterium]|nr:lytic transglycosylase domain-containing protein [Bryobacteraceae bacterium]
MTLWLALFLTQDAPVDRIRAAMEASLAMQRASVQQQARAAGATMTPWTLPTALAVRQMPSIMFEPLCDPLPQPELSKMIDNAAARNGVEPSLILEVARQESGFRPCAISPKGAVGLMQLMPSMQDQFKVIDPFSPIASIDAGAKLLKQLLDRYHGDLTLALSAYNAGAAAVDKAGGIPQIPETQNYVTRILSRLAQ